LFRFICSVEDLYLCREATQAKLNQCQASSLPHSNLSLFIEQRVRAHLLKNSSQAVADSVTVRMVSCADSLVHVSKVVLEQFEDPAGGADDCANSTDQRTPEVYPKDIPFRSKCIMLWQKIDGCDVCIFSMYTQEYDGSCPLPNRGRVYIAYLDSVRFFQPERLRTATYHEVLFNCIVVKHCPYLVFHDLFQVLVGYLEHVAARGFSVGHIWACPPSRSMSYIFWCHPPQQRTPSREHLREWYARALRLAQQRGIIGEPSNLYDHYFAFKDGHHGAPRTMVTRHVREGSTSEEPEDVQWPNGLPPYFEGDCWPLEAEQQAWHDSCSGDSASGSSSHHGNTAPEDLSQPTSFLWGLGRGRGKPFYSSMSTALGAAASSDAQNLERAKPRSWLQRAVAASLQRMKDDHLVLQFLPQAAKLDVGVTVNGVMVDVDPPPTMKTEKTKKFIDTRQALHQLCALSRYQFDTLGRAKHSTMLILHHLHNPKMPSATHICNQCRLTITCREHWYCRDAETEIDLCDCCAKTYNGKHHLTFGDQALLQ
jgi:E1A/CREB-binding protein